MYPIERLPITDLPPESFYRIMGLSRQAPLTELLFREELIRNEIILYTNHEDFSVIGYFPYESNRAYFGFWFGPESVPLHQQAFNFLLEDAQKKKCTSITGPINFNTYHSYRIRLQTPSWGIFDGEPVYEPYYIDYLKSFGFKEKIRYESRMIQTSHILDVYRQKQKWLDQVRQTSFEFIPLTPEAWIQYQDELFELVYLVFKENLEYRVISKEQFHILFDGNFASRLCPHTSTLVMDHSRKQLVALSLCQPNYKMLPSLVEKPNFKEHYPQLRKKTLLVRTVGVHPGYRQQGLMNLIGAYGMLSFREYYEEVIFCLMRSGNYSTHFSDAFPYQKAHYALFENNL